MDCVASSQSGNDMNGFWKVGCGKEYDGMSYKFFFSSLTTYKIIG